MVFVRVLSRRYDPLRSRTSRRFPVLCAEYLGLYARGWRIILLRQYMGSAEVSTRPVDVEYSRWDGVSLVPLDGYVYFHLPRCTRADALTVSVHANSYLLLGKMPGAVSQPRISRVGHMHNARCRFLPETGELLQAVATDPRGITRMLIQTFRRFQEPP